MIAAIHRPTPTRRLPAALALLIAGASACASDDAAAVREPPPLPQDAGHVLALVAQDVQWDRSTLEAPAGRITIRLDNRDRSIPHNVRVRGPVKAFATELDEGPVFQDLTFTIDEPGTYTYICDAHPNMDGELIVGK